jgi:hypothetical protein
MLRSESKQGKREFGMWKWYVFLVVAMLFSATEVVGEESGCNAEKSCCGQSLPYCDIKNPPIEAYPIELNGSYIFSYPRAFNPYVSSQCHTVWDERGKILWSTKFIKSDPVTQEWHKEDGTIVFCEVKDKTYRKDGVQCWNAESIKRVMKAMLPVKADQKVPAERDPSKPLPGN